MDFLRPISSGLSSIEVEVDDKISASLCSADFTKRTFLQLCRDRFGPDQIEMIEKTLVYAESLPSNDPNHPSMKVYFAHPLRVAAFVVRLATHPSTETVSMGLIHNVFEVSGLKEADLVNNGFTEWQAEGIRLLTIDRSRQYDPVYLERFYNDIEAFGPDLTLVKCVDRLDNLLAFDLIERTDKLTKYMDLTERFVLPMAARLSSNFSDYLSGVLNRMRNSECNEELRKRYDLFIQQTTPASEIQTA